MSEQKELDEKRFLELLLDENNPKLKDAISQLLKLEGAHTLLLSIFPTPQLNCHCVVCHQITILFTIQVSHVNLNTGEKWK